MCIYVHVPNDYMFHVLSDYIYIHCNVIKDFIYLCLCPCYYVLHVCMYSHIHVLSDCVNVFMLLVTTSSHVLNQ